MFPIASLLTLVLVLSITGSPIKASKSPVILPITRRLQFSDGATTNNILARDKARMKALRNPSMRGQRFSNVPLTNDYIGYTISVAIGNPPSNKYTLLVDSGSSNTWIGASTPYVPNGSGINIKQPVEVNYGSGHFSGTEYLDYLTLGPGLTIIPQSFGVASESVGFNGVDGVLGIGPVDLTLGTLKDLQMETIPTVTDNLYAQNNIPADVLGIFFQPDVARGIDTGGELTFGGPDPTKCKGDIVYTPITKTNPASTYWGIEQSITYGSETILSSTAGIVDSGTTFCFIATDAYDRYQTATGGTFDPSTLLLMVTSHQYGALKNLDFNIGGQTFSLTPNAQIWPRSLNTKIGGVEGIIYLIVCDLGSFSGQGNDFTNGYVFMQRFYTVFDTTNSRVGFATTSFTDATTN